MKQKHKFKCDDLARSIIERNLRGLIRKCEDGDAVTDETVCDVTPPADAALCNPHPSDIPVKKRKPV